MKKKNLLLRKYILHFLSFLLPSLILILVFSTFGFYPFGEKSVLIMDMNGQYIQFFSSLKSLVSGESSLFFSWSKAMGQNYIALFAYYLSSPLSFITLFFSKENLPVGIMILTILKISLCGLSFSVYLEKVFNENRTFKLYFTTCYALMSYNLVYSLSLMWLDAVILLPIILLGIENIISEKKTVVFVASIALMFISNFYISYSVSIFCVIYYFFRWFSLNSFFDGKKFAKNLLKITLSAVFGIGLSAWILIPTAFDLSMIGTNYQNTNIFNYSFWEIIKKFFPCYYDSITNSGLPAIFCGIGVILLAVAFFFNKKNLSKVRFLTGGVFVIFFLSFWLTPLDNFWHGMRAPNWFPYRYAFLFSFFLIFVAYSQFNSMDIKLKNYWQEIIFVILINIVCCSLYFNSYAMIEGLNNQFGYINISDYRNFYTQTMHILSQIPSSNTEMYRVEKDYEYSKNDAMLFGYNGITHYSSTNIKQINDFTRELGMTQDYFWNSYFGSTPVMDSIFSVKYILSKNESVNENFGFIVNSYNDIKLYQNNFYLPIGFAIQNIDPNYYHVTVNPFVNQNNLLNSLSGLNNDVFHSVDYQEFFLEDGITVKYLFTAKNDEPVYLYLTGGFTYANVFVNGVYVAPYFGSETRGILYLGNFHIGEEVEVKIVSTSFDALQIYDSYIYYIDSDYYRESIKKLQKEGFWETYQMSNGLRTRITTSSNRVCFTSIPYSKGFIVKINGKKTDYFAYADTFLAFNVPEGESVIDIQFVSPGFWLGLCISIMTFLTLLIVLLRDTKNNGKKLI